MAVSPIPAGCNTVNVYLIVQDAHEAMDFYQRAFSAKGGSCMTAPDGAVMHAELHIGNSTIMLSQENPEWDMKSPKTLGGSPISLHLYVEDADAVFQQAIDAGCQVAAPMMDAFWGDRYGKVLDPFGYQWGVATHVEDVDDEEMERRAKAWFASMGSEPS